MINKPAIYSQAFLCTRRALFVDKPPPEIAENKPISAKSREVYQHPPLAVRRFFARRSDVFVTGHSSVCNQDVKDRQKASRNK
jgi:hypothetical protein